MQPLFCNPVEREPDLELRWRWGVRLLFAALTSVVILHQLYPPEPAVNTGFFTGGPPFDDPAYLEGFPDLGSLGDVGSADADVAGLIDHWWEAWKYGADWNDAVIYLDTAATWSLPPPPYRYRPVVPLLVGSLHRLTTLPCAPIFIFINAVSLYLAAWLFYKYLRKYHGFNRSMALVGGCLLFSLPAVLATAGHPLLEPVTLLLSVALFWTARSGRPRLFVPLAVVAVAVKGVLVFAAPLYLAANYRHSAGLKRKSACIAAALVPVLAYGLLRVFLGGWFDEVGYSCRLLKGDLPVFATRLLSWSGWAEIAGRTFSAFTFLWVGLLNLGRDPFLDRVFWLVAFPVTAACVLFSSDIARPLGVIYPIIIPLFLHFFASADDNVATQTTDSIVNRPSSGTEQV
jgi:hypothetical protein